MVYHLCQVVQTISTLRWFIYQICELLPTLQYILPQVWLRVEVSEISFIFQLL